MNNAIGPTITNPDKPNPRNPTLAAPLAIGDRSQVIGAKYLMSSNLALSAARYWNRAAKRITAGEWTPPQIKVRMTGRSSAVASLVAFDQLTDRLKRARSGEAYIAHLLVPHYPYVVREDCSYLPPNKWMGRKSSVSIDQRRRAYFDQIRCVTRKVDAALAALARSPTGANSIVIIHGDHGSRITNTDPSERYAGQFDDRDVVAGFSTLFAVRSPGIEAGYSSDHARVAELLRDFVARDFRSAPADKSREPDSVYLDDRKWKPTRQLRLPADWHNAP